jgi:fatty acid desaturase
MMSAYYLKAVRWIAALLLAVVIGVVGAALAGELWSRVFWTVGGILMIAAGWMFSLEIMRGNRDTWAERRQTRASGTEQHGGRISSEGAPSAPPNEASP